MRADARANRERILQCAEDAFGEYGAALTTEEVARRAGVGIGTVFRHFPTKQRLLEAALLRHVELLRDHVVASAAGHEPGDAVREILREMVSGAPVKTALVAEITRDGALDPVVADLSHEVKQRFGVVLRRAQRAGEIRRDVDIDTVYTLIRGLSGVGADRRALAVLLDGLEPR